MEIEALIARGLQVLLALGGAYFIALWFVLIVWAFRDIESRSRSVVTQVISTLMVGLFWIPGLALYWVLRPKETLDEAYQRSLEEEYLVQDLEEVPLCPKCQHFVEDDFQLCPHCQTQLKDNCHNCNRLVDLRWPVCPYCGDHQHHHHEHEESEKIDSLDDRWIDPAAIEDRLRKQEERRVRSETRALPMATASIETVRDLLGAPHRRATNPSPDSAEPIPQPAHHEPNGKSARTADVPDGEQSNSTATSDASRGESNGSVAEDEDTATKVISEPGPTSLPRRFKVN